MCNDNPDGVRRVLSNMLLLAEDNLRRTIEGIRTVNVAHPRDRESSTLPDECEVLTRIAAFTSRVRSCWVGRRYFQRDKFGQPCVRYVFFFYVPSAVSRQQLPLGIEMANSS